MAAGRDRWGVLGLAPSFVQSLAVGTLFIVESLAGDQADLTRRAQRILAEVSLIASQDIVRAQCLLAQYQIQTPAVSMKRVHPASALAEGDVALLFAGSSLGLPRSFSRFVSEAASRNHRVAPVPGPSLSIAALILSGLPADSFVNVGQLPADAAICRKLLDDVALRHRTLVIELSPSVPPNQVLKAALAGRRGVLVAGVGHAMAVVWSGKVVNFPEELPGRYPEQLHVLVIGGRTDELPRWEEDRLSAAVQEHLLQGLGVKEISHKLTDESGWPRRQIYRRAVQMAEAARLGD
jgi:16S rRNA (cytidine1402-2'-O)-methyltransferase